MFKTLRLLFFLISISLIVLIPYCWINRVPLLEGFLSKKLNAKVSIKTIEFNFQHLALRGIKIDNPPECRVSHAFMADEITIKASFRELLNQQVRINRIRMVNPKIGVDLTASNTWTNIFTTSAKKGNKTYYVDRLIVENLQFEIMMTSDKPLPLPNLPHLELTHIGEDGSFNFTALSQSILKVLIDQSGLLNQLPTITDQMESRKSIFRSTMEEASQDLRDFFSKALQLIPSNHKISGS